MVYYRLFIYEKPRLVLGLSILFKIVCLAVFLFLPVHIVSAQVVSTDSLRRVVSSTSPTPNDKADAYYHLGLSARHFTPDSARLYFNQGIKTIIDDNLLLANPTINDFYFQLAKVIAKLGDHEKALSIAQKIHSNPNTNKDKIASNIQVLIIKSICAEIQGTPASAKQLLDKAFTLSSALEDNSLKRSIHNRLAQHHSVFTNRIDSVLYHYTEAARLTTITNKEDLFTEHYNLGEANYLMAQGSTALAHFLQAAEVKNSNVPSELISDAHIRASTIYTNIVDYAKALNHYRKGSSQVIANTQDSAYYSRLTKKSFCELKLKLFDSAISNFTKSLSFYKEQGNKTQSNICHLALSKAWFDKDKQRSRQFYELIDPELIFNMVISRDKRKLLSTLAELSENFKEYKTAYITNHHITEIIQRKALYEENLHFTKHRIKYENDIGAKTKEYELQSLISQKSRLQKYNTIVIASLFLAICIYFVNVRFKKERIFKTALSARTDQLTELNRELENKRSELERFAFITAHDLKSPTLTILGFTDILERELASYKSPRLNEYIQFIKTSGEQMKNLVQGVLEFAQINQSSSTDKTESILIKGLIQEAIENLPPNINQAKNEVSVSGEDVIIKANRHNISTLFKHLITNGLTYNEEAPPQVDIDISSSKEFITITFKDNGIGIAPEHLGRIFDMFSRLHTNHKYPGSGVGLALSKKIVENLGGTLEAKSVEKEGSVFKVTLPILLKDENQLFLIETSSNRDI